MLNLVRQNSSSKQFYDKVDRATTYTSGNEFTKHPFHNLLCQFIVRWKLNNKRCLEVGSAKGLFQKMFSNYIGVDIVEQLSAYYQNNYIVASGSNLPFHTESFDAIFSYAAYEHVPEIEEALQEIIRVLKKGGVCLFAPAWHTRLWFAQGYKYRPYKDFTFKGKIIKFSIPFRDFILVRWPIILLRRFLRLCIYMFSGSQGRPLKYKRLKPNYEVYWQSDSDACNSLDPFDVIIWFRSRGFICHGYTSLLRALLVRTYALELQKPFIWDDETE